MRGHSDLCTNLPPPFRTDKYRTENTQIRFHKFIHRASVLGLVPHHNPCFRPRDDGQSRYSPIKSARTDAAAGPICVIGTIQEDPALMRSPPRFLA